MPSYHVSRAYVNNVNITNTTVNTTVVNNYYNTTVINKTTVTNVTYVNQRVTGAVSVTSASSIHIRSIGLQELGQIRRTGSGLRSSCCDHAGCRAFAAGCSRLWRYRDGTSSSGTANPRCGCEDDSSSATSVVCQAAASDSG